MTKSIDGPPVTSNSTMKKCKRVSSLPQSTERGYLLLMYWGIPKVWRVICYKLHIGRVCGHCTWQGPPASQATCQWKHVPNFMLAWTETWLSFLLFVMWSSHFCPQSYIGSNSSGTHKTNNTSTTKQHNMGQKSNMRVAVINPTQVLSSCLGVLLPREFTTNTA